MWKRDIDIVIDIHCMWREVEREKEVKERQTERERETDRETDREKDRDVYIERKKNGEKQG